MAQPAITFNRCPGQCVQSPQGAAQKQKGVVLIIALILLIVISLLAVTSMRSAASSESIANNVRTTELAMQAAEIALRHCESSAIKVVKLAKVPPDTTSPEATYNDQGLGTTQVLKATTTIAWQTMATWDGTSTSTYVLPSSLVGGTATYKRPPECMVESLTGVGAVPGTGAAFLITARGFGPEVAATDPANRTRPQGTEVWLQSTIEVQ
jgi:type IV pilus assembly protein PilX